MELLNQVLDFVKYFMDIIVIPYIIIVIIVFIFFYHFFLYFLRDKRYARSLLKETDPNIIKLDDLIELPLINIVIPAWNESDGFFNCLTSIIELTYPKIQVIINAGGSEETLEIANSFKHYKNFKILHQKGGGKLKAINECFPHITEGIVYLIDADTLLSDEILLRMIYPLINNGEYVVIGGTRPMIDQEKKDLIRYLRISRNMNFKGKFSRYLKAHISGANTCMKYEVIKTMKKFSEDKEYAVERSQAADIVSSGYKIYRLVDYRGRIYTRLPDTLKKWMKQRIRWVSNYIIFAVEKDKKGLIKYLVYFLFSMYILIFPVMILIHVSLFLFGIFILFFIYLKTIRKVFYSKLIYGDFFLKLKFQFFIKSLFYMYIKILSNVYIPIELLLTGRKKHKIRRNLISSSPSL